MLGLCDSCVPGRSRVMHTLVILVQFCFQSISGPEISIWETGGFYPDHERQTICCVRRMQVSCVRGMPG